MTPRSIRRAAERKQLKLARKEAVLAEKSNPPTGPKTEEGKAISSLNNLRHGLSGRFRILQSENQADYDHVLGSFREEHQPETATEEILVTKMAEHHWLSRRAQRMQDNKLLNNVSGNDQKSFTLYLRYQTTNDRAFSRCLNDLLKLRKQSNQFESQNAQIAEKQANARLKNAQAEDLELETELKATIQAPIPGYASIPYDEIKELFKGALLQATQMMQDQAA